MKYRLIFIVALLLCPVFSCSQINFEWVNAIESEFYSQANGVEYFPDFGPSNGTYVGLVGNYTGEPASVMGTSGAFNTTSSGQNGYIAIFDLDGNLFQLASLGLSGDSIDVQGIKYINPNLFVVYGAFKGKNDFSGNGVASTNNVLLSENNIWQGFMASFNDLAEFQSVVFTQNTNDTFINDIATNGSTYIAATSQKSESQLNDAQILKIDVGAGSAAIDWNLQLVGSGEERINSLVLRGNRVFFVGDFEDNAMIFETAGSIPLNTSINEPSGIVGSLDASTGEVNWFQKIEATGPTYCEAIEFGMAGELIIAGTSHGDTDFPGSYGVGSNDSENLFVANLKANNGETNWAFKEEGADDGEVMKVAELSLTDDFKIALTGSINKKTLFDGLGGAPQEFIPETNGRHDIFTAIYDYSGNIKFLHREGTSGDDFSNGIATLGEDYLAIAGNYFGPDGSNFDFGVNPIPQPTASVGGFLAHASLSPFACDASFDYNSDFYCGDTGIISPNILGDGGGIFSISSGTIDPLNGNINIGSLSSDSYTVTYTLSNCSETYSFKVVADPGMVNCPSDKNVLDIDGDCSQTVTGLSTDELTCFAESLIYEITYPDGGTTSGSGLLSNLILPIGISTIAYSYEYNSSPETCSFQINVSDPISPIIDCPSHQNVNTDPGECHAIVNGLAPSFIENCSAIINYTISGATTASGANDASGIQFERGSSLVTYEIIDQSNNSATCSFNVEVVDNEPPTVNCPSNVSENLDIGQCTKLIDASFLGITGKNENCSSGILNYEISGATTDSGSNELNSTLFNSGLSTVTYTISDDALLTNSCSFTVEIIDNEDPVVSCTDAELILDATGNATLSPSDIESMASDNCTIIDKQISQTTFNCNDLINNKSVTGNLDASFDGDNDFIEIPGHSSYQFGEDAFTVEISFYKENAWTGQLYSYKSNGFTLLRAIILFDGTIHVETRNLGIPTLVLSSSTSINQDTWYHLAITRDNADNWKLYVDGVLEDSSNHDFNINDIPASSSYYLGVNHDGSNPTNFDFEGDLDEFRMWEYERSQTQIEEFIDKTLSGNEPGLVAYFPFEGGTGTEVIDYSSVNNNGQFGTAADQSPNWDINYNSIASSSEIDVTLEITDNSGNIATCTSNVTLKDDEFPTPICQELTVSLDASGNANINAIALDNGSYDNCGIDTYFINQDSFNAVGVYPVVFTVFDHAGNFDSATCNVTVVDNGNPVALCQDITVPLDASGSATIVSGDIDNGSYDNGPTLDLSIDISNFNCSNLGANTVTLTAEDDASNTSSCIATVNIVDEIDPVVHCQNININLDNTGAATIIAADIEDGTSSDNCGIVNYSLDINTFNCTNIASPLSVTLKGEDSSGNSNSCIATVTVLDNESPTLLCPSDLTHNTNLGECEYTNFGIELDPISASDNCSGLTVSNNINASSTLDSEQFPIGTSTITWTAIDVAGNPSTCSFDLTIDDNEAPTIACPGPIVQDTDAGLCSAIVNSIAPTAFDNCSSETITYTISGATTASGTNDASGTLFNIGTSTVTYIIDDGNGQNAQCSFDITIEDNEAPTISCPGPIVQDTDAGTCSAIVNSIAPTAFDNCSSSIITYAISGATTDSGINDASGTLFNIGTSTVTYIIDDGNGQTAQCSFNITIEDNEAPTIACPGLITQDADAGTCSAIINGIAPTAFDNCASSIITYAISGATTESGTNDASGTIFNIGTSTVTYIIDDGNGQTAQCSFNITIEDNEAPTIACPGPITQDADAGTCSAIINGIAPTAFDNCASSIITYAISGATTESGTNDASGTIFNIGTSTVTYIIDDGNGQNAQCSFDVTIEDNEAPTISCPGPIVQDTDAGICSAIIIGIAPTAFDNCTSTNITYTISGATTASGTNDASGTLFNIGTSTVTYIIDDGNGQNAQCSFDITIEDNEAPTISCPGPITQDADAGTCSAIINGIAPTAFDNCASSIITYAISGATTESGTNDASGTIFNIGTSTVTYIIDGGNGQNAQCSFDITIEDNEAPTISCSGPIVQDTDAGTCSAIINGIAPTAFDNCASSIITYAISGAITASGTNDVSGTLFNIGTSTVTYIIDDGNGQIAQCSFDITIEDNEAPSIACPGPITQDTDAGMCSAIVNGIAPTASDNCSSSIITYTISGTTTASGINDASGTIFNIGTSTVTYIIDDGNGQIAQCSFDITIEDNEAPSIACPGPIVQDTDAGICSAIVNGIAPTAFDNCTSTNITYTISGTTTASGTNDASGTTFSIGTSTVTYTIDDGNGQSAQCSFDVTIEDNEAPSIACPGLIVQDTDAGMCSAIVNGIAPTASDNCSSSIITYTISGATTDSGINDASGTIFNIGTSTVTYIIDDGNGQIAQCSFDITIEDNEAPSIACPGPIVQDTDAGICSAIVNGIAPTAFDNCTSTNITYTISGTTMASGTNDASGTTFSIGTSTVTYTIDDGNGQSAQCSFDVTIEDNEAPSIACPGLIVQDTDAGMCSAIVNGIAPTASDNCSSSIITYTISGATTDSGINDASGTIFNIGTSTVTYIIDDGNGQDAQCSFDVTIEDNEAPTISCPGPIVQDMDAGICGAVVTGIAPLVYDNCTNTNFSYSIFGTTIDSGTNDASGTLFNIGTSTLIYTIDDGNGQSAQCSFDITIEDNQAPSLICVANQLKETDPGSCFYTVVGNEFNPAAFADICSGGSITNDFNSASTLDGAQFPIGTTNVIWTATDAANNSETCQFTINVLDNEAPTISCPGPIVQDMDAGMCSAIVNGISPTTFDNCSSSIITYTISGATIGAGINDASGTTFNIGTSTVTYIIDDGNGQDAQCSFDITIEDNEAPTIACPGPIVQDTDAGICSAIVNGIAPTAFDNCTSTNITYTISGTTTASGTNDASGTIFNIGTSTVTYIIDDGNGQIAQCSFDITIEDNEAPTIACPGPIVQDTDAGMCSAIVNGISPTTFDNCSSSIITYTISGATTDSGINDASGTIFNIGTSTVAYIIDDGNGQIAQCSFDITIEDNEAPSIACPGPIVQDTDAGICSAIVNGIAPTAFDNCSFSIITYTISGATTGAGINDASGTTFNIGTSTVTYIIDDGNGQDAQCSFDITIEDNEAPTIACPGNITQSLNVNECSKTLMGISAPSIVDNCSGGTLSHEITGATNVPPGTPGSIVGTVFEIGTSTVTYTYTDSNLQSSNCSFDVNIQEYVPNISVNDLAVNEQDGSVDVIVNLNSIACQDIVLDYETTDGSANSILDYIEISSSIIILAGTSSAQISIPIVDDLINEGNEEFTLDIISSTSGVIVDNSATITIIDNEAPTCIQVADLTINEDDGSFALPINLSSPSSSAISLDYSININSNNAEIDDIIAAPSGTITFIAGDVNTSISIDIFDDAIYEGDEVFSIDFSNPTNATFCSLSSSEITITDNETEPCISTSDLSINEDAGLMVFEISASGLSESDISFDAILSDISTNGSQDYSYSGPNTLTILALSSVALLSIDIVDDNIYELQEELSFILSNPTGAQICSGMGQAIGTINDNETEPAISIDDITINENDGIVSLTASLSGPSNLNTSVNYATVNNGTAETNDYAVSAGTINFSAGSTTEIINLSINDDNIYETDETFSVQLSSPVNASISDGTGLVTILNDDPFPCLSVNPASVSEDSGIMNFLIETNTASEVDIDFEFTINNIETSAADYTIISSSPINISAGQSNAMVQLQIIDDNISEVFESLELEITSAENATICLGTAIGSITDNDAVSCVSVSSQVFNEGEGTITYELSLSNPHFEDINVSHVLSFAGHTADAADCNLVQNNSLILAGETSTSFDLVVTDDLEDELDESFEIQLNADFPSSMCGTNILVNTIIDNDIPVPTCQNLTVELDDSGSATISEDEIFSGDNSLGTIVSFDTDITSFDCSQEGTDVPVILTITDDQGQTNTCSSLISVEDNLSPEISCQNITIDYDGITPTLITNADFIASESDNCSGFVSSLSQYEFSSIGVFDVTANIEDAAGNINNNTCQVTVNYSGVQPTANCQNTSVYLDEFGSATLVPEDINNNSIGLEPLSYSIDQTNFDCSVIGFDHSQTITLTVTDALGTPNTCTAEVAFLDTISPDFEVLPLTVSLESNGEVFITADDLIDPATIEDNCLVIYKTLSASSFTAPGIYPVTVTIYDSSDNPAAKETSVEVLPNEGPNAVCQDLTLYLDAGGTAIADAMEINNNSTDDGNIINYWLDNNTFDCSNTGSNSTTLFVEDNLNQVNTCQAEILIIDSINPTPNTPLLPIIESDCSILINSSDFPTATDNCANSISATTTSPLEYNLSGTYTIEWLFEDASGNSVTQNQTIIIEDLEAPTITCPADIEVENTFGLNGAEVVFSDPSFSDNCSATIAQTFGQSSGSFFAIGTHDIIYTATDNSGNATPCSFIIVVEDLTAPQIENMTLEVCEGEVYIDTPEAFDNSGEISSISNDRNGLDFIAENISAGTYSIIWTAIDPSGNAIDATMTLNVIPQETAPFAGEDQTLYFIANAQLDAAENPNGLGFWEVIDGSASIAHPDSASTSVSNLSEGSNVLAWIVDNDVCPAQMDMLTIDVYTFDVPNAISPDGDGLNDNFVIPGMQEFSHKLSIFNRWGVKVFESLNGDQYWDGTDQHGMLLPEDTYFVTFEFENGLNHNGFVVLKY